MAPSALSRVQRVASAHVSTRWGDFECVAYRDLVDGHEHLAFVNDPVGADTSIPPVVRLHSECITGDVFGSERCDCGGQLANAMRIANAAERGVVIYMRGHEGRGIGAAERSAHTRYRTKGSTPWKPIWNSALKPTHVTSPQQQESCLI